MLRLYLLRHGKAIKSGKEYADFERHLNKEGVAQINQVGFILREKNYPVDQIIGSAAVRTTQTAQIINHFLRLGKVELDQGFYMAPYTEVLNKLSYFAQKPNVMYVGHNNAISDLASYLTGEHISLSTGQLAEIRFDADNWSLLSGSTGTYAGTIIPDVYSF